MKVEIVDEKLNRMLDRKEITFRVLHDDGGTPSREQILEALSKALRERASKILLPYYRTQSGTRVSVGKAYIPLNGFDISQIEPRYRRKIEVKGSGEEKSEEKS